MTAELDSDGDIYITEGFEFPLWVSISEENTVLKVMTFVNFLEKENVDELKALRVINRINTNFFPNVVSFNHGKLECHYYALLEDTMSEKHLLQILRQCASSFVNAVREEDIDELIG